MWIRVIVPLLLLGQVPAYALSTSPSTDADALVRVLIGSNGVSYSNPRLTGATTAAGNFAGGTGGGFGANSGIILSTGNIADAVGPNNSTNQSGVYDNPGDADLSRMLGGNAQTFDAVALEFDITPSAGATTLKLNYIFASEQYNEFIGSNLHDAMAIFVNGSNAALVPTTRQDVSVTSINSSINSSLFNDNSFGTPIFNTQFDGFTRLLTAEAAVTPGQVTHIKIVIADGLDTRDDSALLLEAGSLVLSGQTTTPTPTPTPSTPPTTNTPSTATNSYSPLISGANRAYPMQISGGKGDMLIYPLYYGVLENYYTLSNDSDKWIQSHIRFNGSGWSVELRDFDIILSPGDVFVFRLADKDGDGFWEIDQSLDPHNFAYNGNLSSCSQNVPRDIGSTAPEIDQCMDHSWLLIPNLDSLATDGFIAHEELDSLNWANIGYITVYGEAVLEGMTEAEMDRLVNENNQSYQTQIGTGRGTSAWQWSDAANNFSADRGLSDVGNWLSGNGFIILPGAPSGIGFNAMAIRNFRTNDAPHRINTYRHRWNAVSRTYEPIDPNLEMQHTGVILHDEDVMGPGCVPTGETAPYGAYVYRFRMEDLDSVTNPFSGACDKVSNAQEYATLENDSVESRLSFDLTWGPTLADGDDYNLHGDALNVTMKNGDGVDILTVATNLNLGSDDLALHTDPTSPALDYWDARLSGGTHPVSHPSNSVAEIETALRVDGQRFTSHYFYLPYGSPGIDRSQQAITWGFTGSMYNYLFPTKWFYGENREYYGVDPLLTRGTYQDYITDAVRAMLRLEKEYSVEIWDTDENYDCPTPGAANPNLPHNTSNVSPYVPAYALTEGYCYIPIEQSHGMLMIENLMYTYPASAPAYPDNAPTHGYTEGRLVMAPFESSNTPLSETFVRKSFPGMFQTFEIYFPPFGCDCINTFTINNWRDMQR